MTEANLLGLEIASEQDLVTARQRARQMAGALGFDPLEQARVATAVSEVARLAFQAGRGVRLRFGVELGTARALVIEVQGKWPDETALHADFGALGARRLVDRFEVPSSAAKPVIRLCKDLPRGEPLGASDLARVSKELATRGPESAFEEVRRQDQALVQALGELQSKSAELVRMNQELEDTNRGVLALYAELDEKAESLRRANETKTSFLSNMTHEFRTPVNSVLNLSRLLLDRTDGELTDEQAKQIRFIQRAAMDLSELVNDLLDLAKVEAGKVAVRVEEFDVASLFGALRGILRPLATSNPGVQLHFDEPESGLSLRTDEGKVAQILRNLVSNAIKYTEQGEVRVTALLEADGATVAFSVSDTGIGIHPEDHERIFEEFTQIDSRLQRRVKGTGLGLPLSRKLASLLGGELSVRSAPGEGSVFTARIPARYAGRSEEALEAPRPAPGLA